MANEITVVELLGTNNDGDKLRYTCASGTAITKGTLLSLSDDRTAAASPASGAPVAGIAAADKDGSDFSTTISVWTNGVFQGVASGAITAGDQLQAGELNYIGGAITASGAPTTIGYATNTAADEAAIRFRLKL